MSDPQGRHAYRYARKIIQRKEKVEAVKSNSWMRPAVEVLFGLGLSQAPNEEEPKFIEPESPEFRPVAQASVE